MKYAMTKDMDRIASEWPIMMQTNYFNVKGSRALKKVRLPGKLANGSLN
jgi:hypothetical protein